MLRAHRLPAVRVCLLVVSVVLWSATAAALAARADPFRAGASARAPKTTFSRASMRRASRKRASAAKRAECDAPARAGKHRKARKVCAAKKARRGSSRASLRSGGAWSAPSRRQLYPQALKYP